MPPYLPSPRPSPPDRTAFCWCPSTPGPVACVRRHRQAQLAAYRMAAITALASRRVPCRVVDRPSVLPWPRPTTLRRHCARRAALTHPQPLFAAAAGPRAILHRTRRPRSPASSTAGHATKCPDAHASGRDSPPRSKLSLSNPMFPPGWKIQPPPRTAVTPFSQFLTPAPFDFLPCAPSAAQSGNYLFIE